MKQFVEYPQLRLCPTHVLAGLRAIEPTADLLYFGRGRWILGCLKPNPFAIAQGEKILKNALWLEVFTHNNPRFTINPAHRRRIAGRVELALLAIQGWKFIGEYLLRGSPDWAIVDDFQRASWMYEHTTDAAFFAALDQPHEQRVAASRADLTDPARGRAAHHWMTSINIAPGIPLDHRAHAVPSSARTTVTRLPP